MLLNYFVVEYIKGRINFIGEISIVEKVDNSFPKLVFVIRKKIDRKYRNIAFECFGKLAEKIKREYRIDDKIEVEYIIQSNSSKNGTWFTNLLAKDVNRAIVNNKKNMNQDKLL